MKHEAPKPPRGVRARRMHATLREVDLTLPKRSRRERVRLAAAIGGCALLAIALTMTIVLHVGRQWIAERVAGAAHRVGVDVTVEFVTFDLIDGLTVEGLHVDAPAPHDLSLVIESATTDVGWLDILSGDPRPKKLNLQRVHAQGRLDDDALAWVEGLRTSRTPALQTETSQGWRGEIHVSDGSANIDINVHLEGLPKTGQTLALNGWEGTLQRQAALQFDATGDITIEGQERTAAMGFRTGPDAAFHITLDDPVGLEVSGLGAPLQLQVEGARWSRRHGALQVQGLGISHGENSVAIKRVQLGGGSFPWVGARAPRSLTLEKVTGHAAGHRIDVGGGSVTLATPQPEISPWLPLPREVRLEAVNLGSTGDGLEATAHRVTLGMAQDQWQDALTDAPGRLIKTIDVQQPSVSLSIADVGLLEETAVAVTSDSAHGASLLDALVSSDDALVIPGASDIIAQLERRRLSVTRGRLLIHSGDTDVQDGIRLDDLSLTWAPATEGGGTASVHALVRRDGKRSGRLDVTGDVGNDGSLRAANGAISGTGLAHVLSRLSEYVTVQPDAWLKADFAYQHSPSAAHRHRVTGEVRFEDFGFEAWRISHAPVAGLEGHLRYEGLIDPSRKTLGLNITEFEMDGARAKGGFDVALKPGQRPSVTAHFDLPKQDCGQLARAVPKALLPRLKGLKLSGHLEAAATFSVDLNDPSTVKLDVDGKMKECRVVTLGGNIDLETLRGNFIHHPVEPKRGRRDDIAVGRGTQQWISENQLPTYLKSAAVMTEDRAFQSHKGVRWDLIGKAIKLNLEQARFAYGGSTITQQLVKNLFLSREKTLSRKLEELIISWELERRYNKNEILELYVNVIEYGPDIYGVRKAAHYYFGKPPWHLSPAESAFIMGLKPYPRAGHRQWQSQTLNGWWRKRVSNVMRVSGNQSGGSSVTFRAPGASFWSGVAGPPVSSTDESPVPSP
ncbi:MAG: transglycosylase domain-containing protein [Myxococcota bacterium]